MAAHSQVLGSEQLVADAIEVSGARVHNLKNISVRIPQRRLTVITGLSGSGKSSLAFDTLHAEGQRQYLETLTPYLRRIIPHLERPDVDWIEGLAPTVAIDQRSGPPPPRTTVATLTEIYSFLRLLYVRVGELFCPQCDVSVSSYLPQDICDALLSLPEGTRLVILAPVGNRWRSSSREALSQVRKLGFPRVRVDGQFWDVDELKPEMLRDDQPVEVVVDRLIVRATIQGRLMESVQAALRIGEGVIGASWIESGEGENVSWKERVFSTTRLCPQCQQTFPEVDLRLLSFHSPHGACPQCEGLGQVERFDPDLVIDYSRALETGAIRLWKDARAALKTHLKKIERLMNQGGFDWKTPLEKIPREFLDQLIYGSQGGISAKLGGSRGTTAAGPARASRGGFVGLLQILEVEYELVADGRQRREWSAFRTLVRCPACAGARLGPLGRSVRVGGMPIHRLCALSIPEAKGFLAGLEFPSFQKKVATPIVREVLARLEFLEQVGLGYLTLDRAGETLSGGELQRVRLAAGLGAALTDVCYIVDEPSVGLHPRDNDRLILSLKQLVERGNTVIVVEHDEAVMRAADWIIDLGPGAGPYGGEVVAAGPLETIKQTAGSVTGQYLSGKCTIAVPDRRRPPSAESKITLRGVTTNNLKNIDVEFPLGLFICVTGVSGSGKSSLVSLTLAPALKRALLGLEVRSQKLRDLQGVERIVRVVDVDQVPLGRSPRSNVATYTGVFDEIRKVFTETRDARRLGFKANRFSFNSPEGRCETCQGLGQTRVEMDFLPDVSMTCPDCQGKRFNPRVLEVRYKDKTIADVLDMSVQEAAEFFENFPMIARILNCLQDVGLGYMKLGQSATALSGGEAQRVKLATELARGKQEHTVYILDEPTTGLHRDDVKRLIAVLQQLVDGGNSVIVVEHHLDVIKCADWVIELGPEGGAGGGHVIASGPPEAIAATRDSPTGRYLKGLLSPEIA